MKLQKRIYHEKKKSVNDESVTKPTVFNMKRFLIWNKPISEEETRIWTNQMDANMNQSNDPLSKLVKQIIL